jgi:hypothetical protein
LLSDECGNDISSLNSTLAELSSKLSGLESHIRATRALIDCSNIVPLIRRLAFGTTCTASVAGVTWLFCSMTSLAILGLIMLSTRAALYNQVIVLKKTKRREKEFEDYKVYMSQYYDDAIEWEINAPKKFPGDEASKCMFELQKTSTFETEESTRSHDELHSPLPIPTASSDFLSDCSSSTSSGDDDNFKTTNSTLGSVNLSALVNRFFFFQRRSNHFEARSALGPTDSFSNSEAESCDIISVHSDQHSNKMDSRGSTTDHPKTLAEGEPPKETFLATDSILNSSMRSDRSMNLSSMVEKFFTFRRPGTFNALEHRSEVEAIDTDSVHTVTLTDSVPMTPIRSCETSTNGDATESRNQFSNNRFPSQPRAPFKSIRTQQRTKGASSIA